MKSRIVSKTRLDFAFGAGFRKYFGTQKEIKPGPNLSRKFTLDMFVRSRAEDGPPSAGNGIWEAGVPPDAGSSGGAGVGAVYK